MLRKTYVTLVPQGPLSCIPVAYLHLCTHRLNAMTNRLNRETTPGNTAHDTHHPATI